jgi:hypothetical protein
MSLDLAGLQERKQDAAGLLRRRQLHVCPILRKRPLFCEPRIHIRLGCPTQSRRETAVRGSRCCVIACSVAIQLHTLQPVLPETNANKERDAASAMVLSSGTVKFRICVDRGRPFIGVAAAKENISALLDPKNTANLEQRVASEKAPPVSVKKHNPSVASDAEVDVESLLVRLSSSSADQPEASKDPTDCLAILRSFQVGSTFILFKLSNASPPIT